MRLLGLCFLFLMSCAKGPAESELRQQVMTSVTEAFGEGFVEMVSFSRRGHHKLGSTEVAVYFKSSFRLLKVKEWTPEQAQLWNTTLGAASGGVKGINSEGNSEGDLIVVYGSRRYQLAQSNWVPKTAPSAPLTGSVKAGVINDSQAEEQLEISQWPAHRKHLKILQQHTRKLGVSDAEILKSEIKKLALSSQVWAHDRNGGPGVAAGEPGGEYHHFARSFEKAVGSKKVKAFETLGSEHNLQLVAEGASSFGILQDDILLKPELRELARDVQPILALFPEAVHVVTLDESRIRTPEDLKGKVVSIGDRLSGSATNAKEWLKRHSLTQQDLTLVHKNLLDSLRDLKAKKLDALIFTGSFPVRALVDFAKNDPIHLVPADSVPPVKARSGSQIVIPSGTYSGQSGDYVTHGTTAVIVAKKTLPASEVKNLLTLLFGAKGRMAKEAPKALGISRDNWSQGFSGEAHAAAKEFFATGN